MSVTLTKEGNGTVEGTGEYRVGEKIELKATADENFKFVGWYIGDTKITDKNPYTYEVQKEITITAKFEIDGILISKITFEEETVSLGINSTEGIQLKYTVEPENATNKSVVWEVDNLDLLTLEDGKIVAKGTEGTAKVICKALYGEARAECTVKIIDGTFIYTPEDLINNFGSKATWNQTHGWRDYSNYYIMADIDMSGYEYTTKDITFYGTLDGQGHVISNLNINETTRYVGLVKNWYGTAESVLFRDVDIIGTSYDVGVLGGRGGSGARVINVGITGNVTGKSEIGSFFGGVYGSVGFTNCYARATLSGSSRYDQGGFVGGRMDSCSFTKCYFSGTMTATGRVGVFQASESNENSSTRAVVENCYYNKDLFTLEVAGSR